MPIEVSSLIQRFPEPAEPLAVTFPCGVEVAAQFPSVSVPDGASMAKQLLAQVNAALAPLMPLLKVVDLALLVVEALQAVPSVLTNPGKLLDVIDRVLKAKNLLVKLLPPVSVPLMALQFLDVLIAYLEGLVSALQGLVAFQEGISTARAQASQYPALLEIVEVAEDNLVVQMRALDAGLEPTNKLLTPINLLMQLAGLSAVPNIGSLGSDPAAAVTALNVMLQTLRNLRAAIPA